MDFKLLLLNPISNPEAIAQGMIFVPKSFAEGAAFGRRLGIRVNVRNERANCATMWRQVVKSGKRKLWWLGEKSHLL
jgi:hypothetical protein